MPSSDIAVIENFRGIYQYKTMANSRNLAFAEKGQNFRVYQSAIERTNSPKFVNVPQSIPSGDNTGDFKCKLNGVSIRLRGIGANLYSFDGTNENLIYSALDASKFLDLAFIIMLL